VTASKDASRTRWLPAAIAGLLCAAPVPGDIGSCGQPVQLLDAKVFFRAKQKIDCQRCEECGIHTSNCGAACTLLNADSAFATGCFPLVHDGEVCLRKLLHTSCGDYESVVSDDAPTVPSECDFCP
jgi:hypothetical protein